MKNFKNDNALKNWKIWLNVPETEIYLDKCDFCVCVYYKDDFFSQLCSLGSL